MAGSKMEGKGGDVMKKAFVPLLLIVFLGFAAAAQWVSRGPIYIHGDEGFTWENGVVRGSGTPEDPYVIEGWIIDTLGYDYGIYIDGTTAHFVIRNCSILYPQEKAGILLSNVENGVIENCYIWGGKVAIQLIASKNIVIRRNAIGYCDYGIIISTGSEKAVVYENSIISCGLPARDEGRFDLWYHEGRGNYWSDYRGKDLDGDGIGDTPYEVVPDHYPLMEPVVKLPPEASPMRTLSLAKFEERNVIALAPGSLVRLVATDVGVGVDKIFYRFEGGEWKLYSEPFPLEGKAVVRLEYYSVDKLGNQESPKVLTIYLDSAPPVTKLIPGDPHYYDPEGKLWLTSRTPLELAAEDDSGVAHIFFRIDEGTWAEYEGPFHIPGSQGPHKLEFYAIDLYGNREETHVVTVWKDDTAPVTRPELKKAVLPAPKPEGKEGG